MATILITGCSSGFGYVTAQALAKRGHVVLATMRDSRAKNRGPAEELLRSREVDGLAIHVLDLDVTSDASVDAAIEAATARTGALDVVVNNAGYTVAGIAEAATATQLLEQLNTNVVGMHRVNRAVLPAMRARRSGLLIHVSSMLGRLVLPFLGPYTASKWAIEALAETYRYELKASGVDVSIVQPGAFPTSGILEKRQLGADASRTSGYGPLENGIFQMDKGLEQLFSAPEPPRAEEVGDAIVALVETPAGKRPSRVVVDRFGGDATRALNGAHDEAQRSALSA